MKTRPGIIRLLHSIKFKNWPLHFNPHEERAYIQWMWSDTCPRTGNIKLQRGRKWYLSMHMTDSEIVQTAFLAAMTAMEHEVREFFEYRNQPIFRPHYDVNALHTLCELEAIDARPNGAVGKVGGGRSPDPGLDL